MTVETFATGFLVLVLVIIFLVVFASYFEDSEQIIDPTRIPPDNDEGDK